MAHITLFERIPEYCWKIIKKLCRCKTFSLADNCFLVSIKYSTVLCVILLLLTFFNKFYRNKEIDCVVSSIYHIYKSKDGILMQEVNEEEKTALENFVGTMERF